MSRPVSRFKLPSKVSDRSVVEALRDRWTLKTVGAGKSHRIFLDTADARLLRGGWTLACKTVLPGATALEVSSASDDTVVASHLVNAAPEWAADLPQGEPWRQLATAIGERRLLQRMNIESTSRRYAILDDEGKTTLWVNLDRHSRTDGPGPVHRIRVATLKPVRGYEKYGRTASKLLAEAGLPSHAGSLVHHLIGPTDAHGGKTQAPRAGGMDRSMPVVVAVSRVLSSLREEMIANETGVRDEIDVEFLHDYRVASRRARSVLDQMRRLLPPDDAETLSSELRWLGTLTGPARDLDVQLGDSHDGVDELEGMRRLLVRKRSEAQEALVAALDSHRYKALLNTWEHLEDEAAGPPRSRRGAEPAGPSIDRHIEKAHRRVLRIGRTIDDSSPAELLHDLRKKTKALRYMLEMFGQLYSASELKTAVRELRALQDNLGEFQDSQVQASAIRSLAEEMLQEKSGTASELMAMGRIADVLDTRQVRARAEFAERFSRFASPEVTRRYRRMYSPTREAS